MTTMTNPTQTLSKDDQITWLDCLKKIPSTLPKLPKMVKGLKYSAIKDPTEPVGLAWAFERVAAKQPDKPALLAYIDQNHDTIQRLTYQAVNEQANQIAHYLQSTGLKKGDVVALLFENRPELLITALALAKLGAVSAMLNTSQTGQVLAHSIQLVTPKAVVVGQECYAQYASIEHTTGVTPYWYPDQTAASAFEGNTTPDGAVWVNLSETCQDSPLTNPPSSNTLYIHDPLFYIYTSGTTGLPKAGVLKQGRWMKAFGSLGVSTLQLNNNDILYSTLPLYHGTALVVCWASVLAGGAAMALRRRFSVSQFWEDTRRFQATTIGYVGELCRYLMSPTISPDDLSNPVTKMVGNGLRPNIWKPFKQRFGIEEVYELYGASDGNIGFANLLNFDNTVGYTPMKHALIAYDKESETPIRNKKGFCVRVKVGEPGLLLSHISDKSPLDGYTDQQQTNKVILQDVFKKGDRWFNSGDLLRSIGCGHLQFVDRLGDTFRWKGENVSTTEVENGLMAFDEVQHAVVYGVEIPETNGRAGMAVVTVKEPDTFLATLHAQLAEKLPHYAIPIFIRVQSAIETTATFKYKKSQLKREGFDPLQVQDPVYVALPEKGQYQRLSADTFNRINDGAFRF